jgi:hypothetical protein
MAMGMNKGDLQALAQSKADDAALLFKNRRFSNAYYLGGYAVELALKAVIAGRLSAETIPDKKFINDVYKHSYLDLVGLAGLKSDLIEQQNQDPAFGANWGIVAEWSPDVRYKEVDKMTAHYFLTAIIHEDHGVLKWIKTFW